MTNIQLVTSFNNSNSDYGIKVSPDLKFLSRQPGFDINKQVFTYRHVNFHPDGRDDVASNASCVSNRTAFEKPPCIHPGCNRESTKKGYCSTHLPTVSQCFIQPWHHGQLLYSHILCYSRNALSVKHAKQEHLQFLSVLLVMADAGTRYAPTEFCWQKVNWRQRVFGTRTQAHFPSHTLISLHKSNPIIVTWHKSERPTTNLVLVRRTSRRIEVRVCLGRYTTDQ